MSSIHHKDPQIDPAGSKILLHQLAPPLLFRLGYLSIAITGQINHITALINAKVVHMRGLAGSFTDPGKIFPQQQLIDDRGLTNIGLSGKSDLRQTVLGKIPLGSGRNYKLSLVQIHNDLTDAFLGLWNG